MVGRSAVEGKESTTEKHDSNTRAKRTRQHGRIAGEFGRHKLHAGGRVGQRVGDAHHQRSQHDRRGRSRLALCLTLAAALRLLRLCLLLL